MLEVVRDWLSVGAAVICAWGVIVVWVKSPGEKVAKSIAEVTEGLKKHDRRIQAVEDEMKHLPTSDEFQELQLSVTRVEGDVKRIEETLGSVKHTVQRIDDYLRESR